MKTTGPRSIADLLESQDFRRLRADAERRRTLTEQVRASLPETDAAHVVGVRRQADGRLVITADSGAWAARIRFIADDAGLGDVQVRVAPPGNGAPGQSGKPGAS